MEIFVTKRKKEKQLLLSWQPNSLNSHLPKKKRKKIEFSLSIISCEQGAK
jgi:hypothetical protein